MVVEVGRLCIKLRGREAGRRCVIVEILDENFVIIDGDVKRRRVNVKHLEFLPQVISIKSGASTEEVIEKMLENKIPVSYWKLKRDNLLNKKIIDLYKTYFGEDWEKIAKSLGSPGKKVQI
ncbi:MAG: 50S ribosomal protein L14e [Nanopusillaceae archaeon]